MPLLPPPYNTYICWVFTNSTFFMIFLFFLKIKKLGYPSLVIYFVYPVVLIGASDLRNSRYLPVASLELLRSL